jgi:hypothetical protein
MWIKRLLWNPSTAYLKIQGAVIVPLADHQSPFCLRRLISRKENKKVVDAKGIFWWAYFVTRALSAEVVEKKFAGGSFWCGQQSASSDG